MRVLDTDRRTDSLDLERLIHMQTQLLISLFLQARGLSVGSSLVEEDKLELARELEAKAKAKGVKFILPTDIVLGAFENVYQNATIIYFLFHVHLSHRSAQSSFAPKSALMHIVAFVVLVLAADDCCGFTLPATIPSCPNAFCFLVLFCSRVVAFLPSSFFFLSCNVLASAVAFFRLLSSSCFALYCASAVPFLLSFCNFNRLPFLVLSGIVLVLLLVSFLLGF